MEANEVLKGVGMIEVLLFLFLYIGCYLISGVIHELGHIFVGLIQGFKFYLLVIGPFGLKRNENDEIVFYIEMNPAYWGGVGGTFPANENSHNFEKFAKVLLAGPLTSITFGLLIIPLVIINGSLVFLLLSLVSIGMGIASLIPIRTGAFYSDGGRWLRMRKEPTRKIELALWNIIQRAGFNQRYTNINLEDVNVLIGGEELNTRYMGHYFLFLHYKEINDLVQTEHQKNLLRELSSSVSKHISRVYPVE